MSETCCGVNLKGNVIRIGKDIDRTHRNLVMKLRKRSKSEYLRKKCAGSGNSKEF